LQWQDACYDVSWSEASDDLLLVATGNGSVVIWDTTQPQVNIQEESTKQSPHSTGVLAARSFS